MRQLLIAGVFAFSGIASSADSVVIPLVDPADPIRIISGRMEFEDDLRPVMLVELENDTDQPINTGSVWLNYARFFTKGEMDRAGNRKVWDCATTASAASRQSPQVIAPGGRASVRAVVSNQCQHNRDHEHFFVEVTRVGDITAPSWKREPGEFVRLLATAQPHP